MNEAAGACGSACRLELAVGCTLFADAGCTLRALTYFPFPLLGCLLQGMRG